MAFARLCRSQRVDNFRFHDLRHTTARWLRTEDADIHTGAQLLGHKDLRMVPSYQHLSPVFLAKVVASLHNLFGIPCYQRVTVLKHLSDGMAVNARFEMASLEGFEPSLPP